MKMATFEGIHSYGGQGDSVATNQIHMVVNLNVYVWNIKMNGDALAYDL